MENAEANIQEDGKVHSQIPATVSSARSFHLPAHGKIGVFYAVYLGHDEVTASCPPAAVRAEGWLLMAWHYAST